MASGKKPSGKKPDPPVKGILKSTSSLIPEKAESRRPSREMKWDEVNIKATFHPPDKTYGHQKVDEPPTPYHFPDESDTSQPLNAVELTSRLKNVELSDQEKARKAAFEERRRSHYNEFQAVKLARHLLEEEEKQEKKKKIATEATTEQRDAFDRCPAQYLTVLYLM